jgi:hypothetical protein
MSSFQKGHQYSNELAEITLTSVLVNLAAGVAATSFAPNPCVAGRNFRVIEVGFTAVTNTTLGGGAGSTVTVDDSVLAAANYVRVQTIPVLTGPTLATGVDGASVSTSRGGAAAWAYEPIAAANPVIGTDGVPRAIAGQAIRYAVTAGGTGTGHVWVKLAPEINRDVDV